ncbi:MAG TPA: hypothetical protein DD435_10510 [Cyanobacteria bacterium UBA8530]|nr:hypothetical protein [Cyanobacteria bacterium UBA8530]
MSVVYWGSPTQANKKSLFISNPVAGASRNFPRDWSWLVASLRNHGWELGECSTDAAGDARRAAERAIRDGCESIVVAGGDGTINEVLQAIAGTNVSLGIVPAGTTNVLSAELGIPSDFEKVLEVLLAGKTRRIDLGKTNGRYFSLVTGIGFDAQMTVDMMPEVKRLVGNFAFIDAWIRAFFTHRARRMVIQIDGKRKLRLLCFMIVVSNTSLYGGTVLKFNERADIADGLLDVCILRSKRWYDVFRHFIGSVTGTHRLFDDIEFFQAKRIDIEASSPVPYQIDADPVGMTPVSIEVAPGALKVIVP